MNFIKELWNNKNNQKGIIDITIFFINLFLLICHVLLMFIYIIIGHKFMILVNIISTLIYISQIKACFKNQKAYVHITFIEIWTHMIFAILSFGWTASFQNWSFALIAAYYLPLSNVNSNKKTKLQSILFTLIIIITYYVISILIHIVNIPIAVTLSDTMNRILFTMNNLTSFITITMLAIFYTNLAKRKEYELTKKADYDELTDLYNRNAIIEISENLNEAISNEKDKYNIAIIDIDFFKNVNDKHGHNSGDMVLQELAQILKSYHKELIPARWGGEEFVILSTVNIKYNEFKNLMEDLRIKVSKSKFKIEKNKNINITISIGTAKVKRKQNINDALKEADERLYKAKKSGRNKVIA